MIDDLSKILIYLSYFSGVVPVYFLFRKKHNLKFRLLKLVGVLLFISLIYDATRYLLTESAVPATTAMNIYFLLYFIILSFIYAQLISEWSDGIYTICFIYTAFFLINSLWIQGIIVVQSYTTAVGEVFLIIYAILYYRYLIKILPVIDPTKYLPFWINSAIAYYFCFNLLLLIFSAYPFQHLREEGVVIWTFHNVNNIIKNIFFAIGIYYAGNIEK